VELAVVGSEGVASISAILGRNLLPFRIVAQVPGHAVRIPTSVVSSIVSDCGKYVLRTSKCLDRALRPNVSTI